MSDDIQTIMAINKDIQAFCHYCNGFIQAYQQLLKVPPVAPFLNLSVGWYVYREPPCDDIKVLILCSDHDPCIINLINLQQDEEFKELFFKIPWRRLPCGDDRTFDLPSKLWQQISFNYPYTQYLGIVERWVDGDGNFNDFMGCKKCEDGKKRETK